jgi:hypothetical protein
MAIMDSARKWHVAVAAGLVWAALGAGQARGNFYCTPRVKVPDTAFGGTPMGGVISADGLTIYIASDTTGNFDLYTASRPTKDSPWGALKSLGPTVNSPYWDHAANVSADGLSLFFPSDRPGGSGDMDIWVSTRPTADSPWYEPVNLGPTVNSSARDMGPKTAPDGLTLYFHSMRPGGVGGEDIWVTTRATKDAPWGAPVNLGANVNSMGNDGEATISPDGLALFFNSDRPGGSGNYDLWVTTRPSVRHPWGLPRNLGPSVNSSTIEWCGSISADGTTLYFVSDYPQTWGPCSVYQTTLTPTVDFNGDGKVDGADLRIMVENWGTDEPWCDIGPMPWGDGIVDTQDLLVLSRYVGQEVIDPAVIFCCKLDETEGMVAGNSAEAPDATLLGDPLWRPTQGAVGGAIELDGVDDCLQAAFYRDPAQAPWSLFVWVKGGLPGQVIVAQQGGANWLAADATGALMTDLRSPGRASRSLSSQAVITDGQWHRIGLIWDGLTRTLCVDGAVVADDTQSALKSAYGGLSIGCGADSAPGSFWSGLIDDVRIYNRVMKP